MARISLFVDADFLVMYCDHFPFDSEFAWVFQSTYVQRFADVFCWN